MYTKYINCFTSLCLNESASRIVLSPIVVALNKMATKKRTLLYLTIMARNHVAQKGRDYSVYDVHHHWQTPLSVTQRISWIKLRPMVSWQLTRGLTKPLWTIE
ncbi:hypothetical protein CEXT_216801 [Caerostris extrusa]|uniref:Uncharacterized protein n=1 Tax=Caerostris extrusa TaxID=172846 RepID=A0AAV4QCV2_CAEEX|nr:hypothetical protein CEXT_216801 [Caerostris extrusa]